MKNNNPLTQRISIIASFVLLSFAILTSCKKDEVVDPALAITSVSPLSGKAGDVITITGTGFDGTTATNNTVKFGTTTTPVLAATATSLVVQVPAGITGPVKVQKRHAVSDAERISIHITHLTANRLNLSNTYMSWNEWIRNSRKPTVTQE